jgi:cell division protease FtsH
MEGKPLTDGKAKALVAYHEVGHAVCSTLTPGHDAVQKVTLIPRGQARGLTWFQPGDDPTLISKQQMFARIVGALGGRAAEEVIFGTPEVTTGASSDLQQVTQLAKQMVINYGFSDIGPWSLMDPSGQSGDMIMRMMARNSMSEALQVSMLAFSLISWPLFASNTFVLQSPVVCEFPFPHCCVYTC